MRSTGRISRTVMCVVAVAVVSSCGSGADDDRAAQVDGVLLSVVPDLSDEPVDVAFAAVPDLLVTGDGRVIYAAPDEFAIRDALVLDVWMQVISPAGVELVRESVAAGEPPRTIEELRALAGPELGDVAYYFPETFRFAAVEFGPEAGFDAADTPLVEWPDTASIALADAVECTRLPELEVGEAFATAVQDSAFVDNGIIYGVVAAPDWPGAPCALAD